MYFYNTDRQSEIPDEENATVSNAMQKVNSIYFLDDTKCHKNEQRLWFY